MSQADSMAKPLYAIVLAAGQGTRMRSARAKVLHKILGRTMCDCSLALLGPLGVSATALVLGHQADAVEASVRASGLDVPGCGLRPNRTKGTADAVRSALPSLPELAESGGKVLILYGDTPLLSVASLQELIDKTTGKLGLLSTILSDPHGYGRLIRTAGKATAIVEHKDCTPDQLAVCEVNAGFTPSMPNFCSTAEPGAQKLGDARVLSDGARRAVGRARRRSDGDCRAAARSDGRK